MGKKNKNRGAEDDEFAPEQQDNSKKYMSLKALGQKEAEVANQGKSKNTGKEYDSGDEEVIQKKKGKRSKKGGKQQDEEFGNQDQPSESTEVIGKKKDDGSADEQDIQNQIEDHFEGVGKKNTRKKKNKESAYAAQNQGADSLMAAAFDEGADSDEVHARKGGKKDKKDKHQGKKKNKNKHQSDDELPEEEKVEESKEEVKEPESGANGPLEVIYCKKCGLPPEYCSFGQKDITACKDWLKSTHSDLFAELYPDEANEEDGNAEGSKPEVLEKKADGAEDDQITEQPKPKKKVKFSKNEGIITVTKLHRGGKKVICQITGFEYYTKDLKSLASKFGKKFACGSAVAVDDIYGECVSVQGDIEDLLLDYLEQDKFMKGLEIPFAKIIFEDKGNKKGRKRA